MINSVPGNYTLNSESIASIFTINYLFIGYNNNYSLCLYVDTQTHPYLLRRTETLPAMDVHSSLSQLGDETYRGTVLADNGSHHLVGDQDPARGAGGQIS